MFVIFTKGKDDLQTEADRAAQRCIIASLHRQFPAITIYGEEVINMYTQRLVNI